MTDTHTIVREIITGLISNKPNYLVQVGSGQRLDDLGFDSLDIWEIALKIEERFNIDIEHGVPEAWATVQDVIDSVLNELGERVTTGENPATAPGSFYERNGGRFKGQNHMTPEQEREYLKPAINRIERTDIKGMKVLLTAYDALNDYQRIATKSAIYPGKGTPFGLMYAALGLAEAGEVQNKVKKAFRDDNIMEFGTPAPDDPFKTVPTFFHELLPHRRAQIIKELGGNLWYIAAVCNEIGATMSEVALQNLDELCGRGERDTLRGDGDNR